MLCIMGYVILSVWDLLFFMHNETSCSAHYVIYCYQYKYTIFCLESASGQLLQLLDMSVYDLHLIYLAGNSSGISRTTDCLIC